MPVELRSDTFTLPTESMRRATSAAEVGDDVWDEDPTIHRLQEHAAEMVGKEASLFVPSGKMGNLCALLSHTEPGVEGLLEGEGHIFHSEVASGPGGGGIEGFHSAVAPHGQAGWRRDAPGWGAGGSRPVRTRGDGRPARRGPPQRAPAR